VGQRYAWQVRVASVDDQVAFANNGLSDVGSFVYGSPPCPPPAQLQTTVNAQENAVQLSWQPPLEADPSVQSYRLTYAAAPNGLPTQRTLNATDFLLLQLPAGQTYNWRVQSLCPQGQSVAVVSSFVLPAPPTQAEPAWMSDPTLAYVPPQDPTPSPQVLRSRQYEQQQQQIANEKADQTEQANETDQEQQAAAEAAATLDDLLNTPVKIYVAAQGQDLPQGLANPIAQLPAHATTQQLQDALKKQKPKCSGLNANYVCGNHDIVPTYNGSIIPVTAGDEIAMGTPSRTR